MKLPPVRSPVLAAWFLVLPLAFAVGLAGCVVVSIEPVITDSAAVFEPGLLGTWRAASDSDLVEIVRSGPDGYLIRHRVGDDAHEYRARAGRLGDRLVLEIRPAADGDDLSAPGRRIPVHQLLALDLHGDRAETAFLELDTLHAALARGDVALAHLPRDDGLLLTGPSEQLRAVLREYVTRPGAFGERTVWQRLSGRPEAPVAPQPASAPPCFEAAPWPEADRLFRRDPRWVGSDGAWSIALGRDRTLWLFGDSWVDTTARHTRRGARMIRNSIAIQEGADPSTASITFYWGRAAGGGPASFFPEEGTSWFWPGHGIRVGQNVIVFLCRVLPSRSGLGFSPAGWEAVMIRDPDAEPPRWRVSRLRAPQNALGVAIGSAGVLRQGEFVYAFSSLEPVSPHPMYLVRWRAGDLARGDLTRLEWWGGPDGGWLPDTSSRPRHPVFLNGQSELSVHLDSLRRQFLSFQTVGFGAADVAVRAADDIAGPWSDARIIYRPPEFHRRDIMIYAGKAHPQLRGADVVLTYATNSFDFADQFADSLLYYPRFVRLQRCR